jgi:hypothetical protein
VDSILWNFAHDCHIDDLIYCIKILTHNQRLLSSYYASSNYIYTGDPDTSNKYIIIEINHIKMKYIPKSFWDFLSPLERGQSVPFIIKDSSLNKNLSDTRVAVRLQDFIDFHLKFIETRDMRELVECLSWEYLITKDAFMI